MISIPGIEPAGLQEVILIDCKKPSKRMDIERAVHVRKPVGKDGIPQTARRKGKARCRKDNDERKTKSAREDGTTRSIHTHILSSAFI